MTTSNRALRIDAISLDPPGLRGIHCASCTHKSFPSRELCPHCGSDAVEELTIASHGTVASWTIVRQAPPPTETPYTLAAVDFGNDIRVLGRTVGDVEIGTEVTVELFPINDDQDGNKLWWYRFRPQGAKE